MSRRPLIKVCGVTRVADAELCAELGVDLLGLNFWPQSRRVVGSATAREIAAAVRGRCRLVGVFVNAPAQEVSETAERVGLDLVQLHGDEPDEQVASFAARALVVCRAGSPRLGRLAAFPAAFGFLVDSGDRLRYGGTGEAWAWAPLPQPRSGQPILVAGGIRPENVRAALQATGADGVDVASGVESAPGEKDAALIRRLCEEVEHGATARGT